jgi:hypothetical protein
VSLGGRPVRIKRRRQCAVRCANLRPSIPQSRPGSLRPGSAPAAGPAPAAHLDTSCPALQVTPWRAWAPLSPRYHV